MSASVRSEEVSVPWTYNPGLVSMDKETFETLLYLVQPLCDTHSFIMYDREIVSPRISCIFGGGYDQGGYDQTPSYDWREAPNELISIREQLERHFGMKFDYVLVNVYRTGKDHIGFHNDKEALNSEIVSVSLGATRRFQFRPIKAIRGYTHEYVLRHGDVIHMKGPSRVGSDGFCSWYPYSHPSR